MDFFIFQRNKIYFLCDPVFQIWVCFIKKLSIIIYFKNSVSSRSSIFFFEVRKFQFFQKKSIFFCLIVLIDSFPFFTGYVWDFNSAH